MVDIDSVVQHLVLGGRKHPLPSSSLSMELLNQGVVHADYGDAGHVFRIAITQVPRVQVASRPAQLGEVDVAGIGRVQLHLLKVELANHLIVVLHGRQAGEGSHQVQAEEHIVQRLQALQVLISDDVGGTYRLSSGEGGAEGTATTIERFLPLPAVNATCVVISLYDAGALVGTHQVSLPVQER